MVYSWYFLSFGISDKILVMRKFTTFLKILLIVVALGAGGWYAFGQGGPFETQGKVIAQMISEKIGDVDEAKPHVEDKSQAEETEPVEEEIVEEEAEPLDLTTSIVFTGDVELSEYVQANYDNGGIEAVVSPEILALLNDADITMINNEFCFSTRGQKAPDKEYNFRVNPSYVSILTDAGVDIAGLANNHVLDYESQGLLDTFTTLTDAGIEYTGAGNTFEEASRLVIREDDKGRTYGFLAASHVIPVASWNITDASPGEFCFYDETALLQAIEEADKKVDYLFVMVHWGTEHTTELTEYQTIDGHKFIDMGAEAVIGMHSHCLQPVEIYNGKPIFYSLGNFIFNQTIKSGGGGAVEFTIDENDEITYRVIPIRAQNACTDEAIKTDPAAYDYIESISEGLVLDEAGYIEFQ
ncbi:MAG: CapA family protein [Pseudobutyrivibrio sp.]|nr:CapA family protein [Pseudobutyrivibrio sp.]